MFSMLMGGGIGVILGAIGLNMALFGLLSPDALSPAYFGALIGLVLLNVAYNLVSLWSDLKTLPPKAD